MASERCAGVGMSAISEMTNSAWKRGRRIGFLEGLLVGFLACCVLVFIRFG